MLSIVSLLYKSVQSLCVSLCCFVYEIVIRKQIYLTLIPPPLHSRPINIEKQVMFRKCFLHSETIIQAFETYIISHSVQQYFRWLNQFTEKDRKMFTTRTNFDAKLKIWSGSEGVLEVNSKLGFGQLLLNQLYKLPADYVIQVILIKSHRSLQ